MITDSLNRLSRRFVRDESGNFMMLFGLGIAVIFMTAGLAFDYSIGLMNKTRVNNALDAATLAAARGISAGELSADVDGEVENYLKAVFAANLDVDDLDASIFAIDSVTVDTNTQSVSATATIDQPLHFIKVGTTQDTMDIGSESAVSFDIGNVEVAMILDVTGSMSGSKLSALKDSAKLGVEELLSVNTNTSEKVRISIVPYARGVNVGSDLSKYVYADYFYETSDAPTYDSSLFDSSGVGYDWATFQSGFPSCSGYNCWDIVTESDGTNSDYCAADRKEPTSGTSYQYSDANPSNGMISRDARLEEDDCPSAETIPLTSTEATLKTAINAFSASGVTAGHMGLQWGWYTISHDWEDYLPSGSKPGDHTDPDEELSKYIIMMTDGEFNMAYADVDYTNQPKSVRTAASYTHFIALCTAIKNDNITIFTIGFYLNDATAKTKLDNCATDDTAETTYYYDVDSSSELEDTFEDIAKTIQSLRLTK